MSNREAVPDQPVPGEAGVRDSVAGAYDGAGAVSDHAGLHQRIHDLEAHIKRLHRQQPITDRASLIGEVRKAKATTKHAIATCEATQVRLDAAKAANKRLRAERDELRAERDAARVVVKAARELDDAVTFHNEDIDSWLPKLHALFAALPVTSDSGESPR